MLLSWQTGVLHKQHVAFETHSPLRTSATLLCLSVCTQTGIHEKWGGVKPDAARDAHAAAITGTVDAALQQAGVSGEQLTAVAVTVGPGLSLCLQVCPIPYHHHLYTSSTGQPVGCKSVHHSRST